MRQVGFFILVATVLPLMAIAQSTETFSTIRLEDATTGNTISLSPSSLTSSYQLTFPASVPTIGPTSVALVYNRITQSTSFNAIPTLNLSPQQVAYLDADGATIRGSSSLMWDTTATQLRLSTAATGTLLSVTRSPASTMPLATFTGGNVGIGTTSPNVALDVDGDIAIRELNYTSAIAAATNNDFDFGSTNRAGFVRLGTALAASRSFTGFVGGRNGKKLEILNSSGQTITLVNESNLSIDTSRIVTADGANLVVTKGSAVVMTYSAAEQRWRVTSVSPSKFQNFSSTDYLVPAAGPKELPANDASYAVVATAGAGEQTVTMPDGIVKGQIFVVQNDGPGKIKVSGPNVNSGITELEAGEAMIFVWDGNDWQPMEED